MLGHLRPTPPLQEMSSPYSISTANAADASYVTEDPASCMQHRHKYSSQSREADYCFEQG